MERMLVSAAPYFRDIGIVGCIVAQGDKHPYRDSLMDAGYSVVVCPPLDSVRGLIALRKELRRQGPDVVHIHVEGSYPAIAFASRMACPRVPIVRTVHNIFMAEGWWRVKRKLYALFGDALVDHLIAPSVDVRQNEASLGRRLQVIENWVDDRFFEAAAKRLACSPSQRLAVIVGNCSKVKRHEIALMAAENAGYTVAHFGSELGASAQEAYELDRLSSANRVEFRGISDPLEWLIHGSVYMMPSTHEGMSVALLEALVVGVPILASDRPGFQWLKGYQGVSLIHDGVEAWEKALRQTSAADAVQVDVRTHSAVSGASAYGAIYSNLVR
jgi:glycosyltransferase involved in cell wall biosynthesis